MRRAHALGERRVRRLAGAGDVKKADALAALVVVVAFAALGVFDQGATVLGTERGGGGVARRAGLATEDRARVGFALVAAC